MIKTGNDLMKMVRKELGLNQAQMAERMHMAQRTLVRIETGERNLGILEYFLLMQILGAPTEDLLPLLLESKELKDYYTYKKLKNILKDWNIEEIENTLHKLENTPISKQPFVAQFISFVKISIDEQMPHEQALKELYETLSMSIRSFDEARVKYCRFTYVEICILLGISSKLEALGKPSCAIDIYKDLLESRSNSLTTDEDKAMFLPAILFNLSNVLGRTKKYKESLSYCMRAHEICISYENYRLVPNILYNMACCYRLLGEEEKIYQAYFIRAYHSARAMENKEMIDVTKKEAEKFGILNM